MPIDIEEAKHILVSSQIELDAFKLIQSGPEDADWPTYSPAKFAAALAYHSSNIDFSIRYLQPGKSAIVVLLCPHNRREKPTVLKFGEKGWDGKSGILQEVSNYEKLKYLGITKPNPPRISPLDMDPVFSSICYDWGAAYTEVATLGMAIANSKIDLNKIKDATERLLNDLWQWYDVEPTRILPAFDWYGDKKSRIRVQLQHPDLCGVALPPELLNIITTGWKWRLRLNESTSAKITHGDLNAGNILLTTDAVVQPILIDFQDLRANTCPARDWAKLERDLKFISFYKAISYSQKQNFSTELQRLNDSIDHDFRDTTSTTAERFAVTIRLLREKYQDWVPSKVQESRMGPVEYFYNLTCWELEYLCKKEFRESAPQFQQAVAHSVKQSVQNLNTALEQCSDTPNQRQAYKRPSRPPVLAPLRPIHPLPTAPKYTRLILFAGLIGCMMFPFLSQRAYPGHLFHIQSREDEIYERGSTLGRKFTGQDLRFTIMIQAPPEEEYAAYVLGVGLSQAKEQFSRWNKGWVVYGVRDQDEINIAQVLNQASRDFEVSFSESGEIRHLWVNPDFIVDQGKIDSSRLYALGAKYADEISGYPLSRRSFGVRWDSKSDSCILRWSLPPKTNGSTSTFLEKLAPSGHLMEATLSDEAPGQFVNSIPYASNGNRDLRVIGGVINVLAILSAIMMYFKNRPAIWKHGVIASILLASAIGTLAWFMLGSLGVTEMIEMDSILPWLMLALITVFAYMTLASSFFYISRHMPAQLLSLRQFMNKRVQSTAHNEILLGIALGCIFLVIASGGAILLGDAKLAAFPNLNVIHGDANSTMAAAVTEPLLRACITTILLAFSISLAATRTTRKEILLLTGMLAFVATARLSQHGDVYPYSAYLIASILEGAAISWVFISYGIVTTAAFVVVRINYLHALTVWGILRDSSAFTAIAFAPLGVLILISGILYLRAKVGSRKESPSGIW